MKSTHPLDFFVASEKPERKIPVGVTLSPSDLERLTAIEAEYDLTRSAAVRACVKYVYDSLIRTGHANNSL